MQSYLLKICFIISLWVGEPAFFPSIRILDLDELSEAFEQKLIDEHLLKKALTSLGDLMDAIYENSISALEAPIIKAISQNT